MNRSLYRWAKPISYAISLLIVGVLLVFVIRIAVSLRIVLNSGSQFALMIQKGTLNQENWQTANQSLDETTNALSQLDHDLALLKPGLQRLSWVPKVGVSLSVLPTTVHCLNRLVMVGKQITLLAQPSLVKGEPLVSILPQIAAADHTTLASLITATQEINDELAQLPMDETVEPLAEGLAQLQSVAALLHGGLRLSNNLLELVGLNEDKQLLILVQNNYELRPTGGFITAIGMLTLRKGRIQDFSVEDSYAFPIGDGPLPRAPLPMQRFMNINSLLLRDANWSPDFPDTAQLASALYFQSTNRRVDGVLSIDLRAVEFFVAALQPIILASSSEPITSDNLVQRMLEMWSAPPAFPAGEEKSSEAWWLQRKDFIPLLASALLTRLQSGAVDPIAVAHALHRAVDERALQFWSRNAEVQDKLSQLGWDSAMVAPPNADFLAVVDSNLGYNKVDAVLQRSLYYQLQWNVEPGERGLATVLLTYHHPLVVEEPICEAHPEYGDSYDDMMARCYFDFVRLYVPAGSELVGMDGIEPGSQLSQPGEGGTTVFGGYFTVKPGEEKKVIIQYRLPPTITQADYKLTLRKQAGVAALQFDAWDGSNRLSTVIEDGRFIWQPAPAR